MELTRKRSCAERKKISLQTEQLSKLVCPVCYQYMRPPIMQCEKGHGICELCHELLTECPLCHSELTHRRSSYLENLTGLVLFPCKQCKKNFALDDLNRHECSGSDEDSFSMCLIGQVYGECKWSGQTRDMIEHCSLNHPENYWTQLENHTKWKYTDLSNVGIQNVFILHLNESIFVIVQKYDSNTKSLHWNVSCECDSPSDHFMYEIQILSCDLNTTRNYKKIIIKEENIMSFLPSSNEIVVSIDQITEYLCNDNFLNYRVIISKTMYEPDEMVNGVKVVSDDMMTTGITYTDHTKSCVQKSCSPIIYIYSSIKKRFNCTEY